ncbi:hypothetical protein [Parazoarcus communis]|nr:hypothetical protein [Parazoarcus communis]
MAGSHRLLVNLEGELASQPDLFSKLNHIYDLPFYALPHPQGGLVVMNMRNIVALTYLPGLKEYPKGYLPAERC